MPKRITVSMVAERAGVSRGVVYAVLNPEKKTNIGVGEEKREAVRRVLDELGYIPDMSARALASGRTSRIGILMSVYKPVGMRIGAAIQEALTNRSYAVLLEYHQSSPERERERLKLFFAHGIDALVISRTSPEYNCDLLDRFLEAGIRVISLGDDDVTRPEMDSVAFDSVCEMQEIVRHAEAYGYRRMAYLGLADQLDYGVEIRGQRFREAVARYDHLEYCGSERIASFDELLRYAERLRRPDAPELVACFNDELADALVKALKIIGIRVPEEIGVTGIDGVPDPMFAMPLTTMRLPIEEMADAVCEVLTKSEIGQHIVLQPKWISGATTRNSCR